MDRLTVESPIGVTDVVLRRWPHEHWTEGLVAREADALTAVRGHGVPAPELLAMDETGAESGVRCTLTSALAGHPDLCPADRRSWLSRLATAQAAIHAVGKLGSDPMGRVVRRRRGADLDRRRRGRPRWPPPGLVGRPWAP
jgi:hypothetical protein